MGNGSNHYPSNRAESWRQEISTTRCHQSSSTRLLNPTHHHFLIEINRASFETLNPRTRTNTCTRRSSPSSRSQCSPTGALCLQPSQRHSAFYFSHCCCAGRFNLLKVGTHFSLSFNLLFSCFSSPLGSLEYKLFRVLFRSHKLFQVVFWFCGEVSLFCWNGLLLIFVRKSIVVCNRGSCDKRVLDVRD